MKKRRRVGIVVLLVGVGGFTAWQLTRTSEPSYNGKTLTQWLDQYNQAGSLEQTEPASAAIRAMGTNCLPHLLKHLKHAESHLRFTVVRILGLQKLVNLPVYEFYPYRQPSLLALQALGARSAPILPELRRLAEAKLTCTWGTTCLFAVGSNAIPSLEEVCQSSDPNTRADAAVAIATLQAAPQPLFKCYWFRTKPFRPRLVIYWVGTSRELVQEMLQLLDSENPAVRRASADAAGQSAQIFENLIPPAIKRLTIATNDPNPQVRESALSALSKLESLQTSRGPGK